MKFNKEITLLKPTLAVAVRVAAVITALLVFAVGASAAPTVVNTATSQGTGSSGSYMFSSWGFTPTTGDQLIIFSHNISGVSTDECSAVVFTTGLQTAWVGGVTGVDYCYGVGMYLVPSSSVITSITTTPTQLGTPTNFAQVLLDVQGIASPTYFSGVLVPGQATGSTCAIPPLTPNVAGSLVVMYDAATAVDTQTTSPSVTLTQVSIKNTVSSFYNNVSYGVYSGTSSLAFTDSSGGTVTNCGAVLFPPGGGGPIYGLSTQAYQRTFREMLALLR